MAALSSASPSSHDRAQVSSFRDDPARPPSSSSPSPSPSPSHTLDSPSIYVTFKVLQLVTAFRKRVTRKHTAQAATKKVKTTADTFCQDFEREAFEEIDRYLGRKTRHPASRRSKTAGDTAGSGHTAATKHEPSGKSIDWLLDHLNQPVRFGEDSVRTVAKSNQLFLRRQVNLSVDSLGVKELCELLITVKDLVGQLQDRSGVHAICKGDEPVGCCVDDTYTANLLHLLLRLQGELVRLLVAKLVELVHRHVSECQKAQSKEAAPWFSEFSEGRHPLSTTWPWNIKPSLAVLWGVCWMFYDRAPTFDKEWNLVDERGNIQVPKEVVIAYHLERQRAQQTQHQQRQSLQRYMQTPGDLTSTTGSKVKEEGGVLMASWVAAPRQGYGARGAHAAGGNPRFPISPSASRLMAQPQGFQALRQAPATSTSPHHPPSTHRLSTGTPDQAAHATSSLAVGTNNLPAYATQPPPSSYAQESSAWAPQDSYSHDLGFHAAYGPTAAGPAAWNPAVSVSYLAADASQFDFSGQAALPPRARHPPAIITTDLSHQYSHQQQPQDFNSYSATSVSTNSSIPLRETPSYPNYQNQHFGQSHLSPHSPYMADVMPDAREMQTTTPPRSPHHDMSMAEPLSRKRSHSQISNGPPFPPADGSHHGSQLGEEEFEPGRIQVQRADPMMNEQRKYICNMGGDECGHLTFDRKCEWSKHMDKHDRPYRCQDPGCAKLQGFTYSGGLLRHEREVHGKHGGPKAQLMCPYQNCKRHSGKGFTRKENLNEHVRRVHHNREQHSQSLKHEPGFDVLAGATRDDTAETPASVTEAILAEDELQSPAAKRRRPNPNASERSTSEDVEDLRRQIEQLQQENAQKDSRLRDMERMVAEMDRKLQEQQMVQNQWHEHQQIATAAQAQALASAAQQA